MNIFYNSLGEFQWASVAAIIAGLGAVVSLLFSILGYRNSLKSLKQQEVIAQKNIDANLKAKARIEWIQVVRKISGEYISAAYKYRKIYKKIYIADIDTSEDSETKVIGSKDKNENHAKLVDAKDRVIEIYNVLCLYFVETKKTDKINAISNKEVVRVAFNLKEQVKRLHYCKPVKWNDFYIEGVEKFRDTMRNYLKNEWDRAKEGK